MQRLIRHAILFALILLMSSCFREQICAQTTNAPIPVPPLPTRSDVPGTVRLLIRELEAPSPDYSKILQEYAWPENIAKVKEHGEFDRYAKFFAAEVSAQLLGALKFVQDKAPVVVSPSLASYDLKAYFDSLPADKRKAPADKLEFVLVEGKWYLK